MTRHCSRTRGHVCIQFTADEMDRWAGASLFDCRRQNCQFPLWIRLVLYRRPFQQIVIEKKPRENVDVVDGVVVFNEQRVSRWHDRPMRSDSALLGWQQHVRSIWQLCRILRVWTAVVVVAETTMSTFTWQRDYLLRLGNRTLSYWRFEADLSRPLSRSVTCFFCVLTCSDWMPCATCNVLAFA